ncbi:hypothetical protein [Absidia glauca]|uniref:Uncharacterized protein n=1 Tax=Absidia glauca TaxID=4829 RepID=A0A163IXC9_ABSGL|nr:hypothetical protein [Absidia glauca]
MSVLATVALLNGNETDPLASPKRPNPPPMTKTVLTNWTNKTSGNDKQPTLQQHKPTASTKPAAAETSKRTQQSRSTLDMHIEELTAMYQSLLDEHASATDTITKLEAKVEIYACDSTKVRDYEIRVEYLAQKLEQVSEERDSLEEELASYKDRHGSLVTPVSPAFGPDLFGGKPTLIEAAPTHHKSTINGTDQDDALQKQQKQQMVEDTYFDEILDAYEERRSENSDGDDDMQQSYHNQIEQMRAEYDQGMKMAMESYVADLEKQRLENKTLQSMVKKQDELISKLESQSNDFHGNRKHTPSYQAPSSGDHDLLHQQVELQQIELESKRELLTQLLNERDDLLKKSNKTSKQQSQRRSPSFRSSIDVLAELARTDGVPRSPGSLRSFGSQHQLYQQQRDTGRSTPPPFAPPRTPLPPVPHNGTTNDSGITTVTSPTRNSLISYSRSSTSSTSWSLDERQQQQQQQQQQYPQHPLSTIAPALPQKYDPIDNDHANYAPLTATDAPPTSGSFWKGLKKKF